MSGKRKTCSPLQAGVSISPAEKKTRNRSEDSDISSDIVLDALDMAENVSLKLDQIMKSLEKLSLIESRLDGMASTMANIESTLCRLDVDVSELKEGAGKRERKINELEVLINYTEDDIAELQTKLHDYKAQLEKCKKDVLYLEAYSRRENVKIFGIPESTVSENTSDPEDTRAIVYNFFEHELQIENHTLNTNFSESIAWENPTPHYLDLLFCGFCDLPTKKKL